MKIVIVADSYEPTPRGGAQMYTKNLVDGLSKRHKVFVITRKNSNIDRNGLIEIAVEEKLSGCGPRDPLLYNFEGQRVYQETKTVLAKIKPDVLHFQHFHHFFLPTIALSSSYPSVVTLHEYTLKLLSFILNKPTLDYFLFYPQRFLRRGFLLKKFSPLVKNYHFMKDVKALIAPSQFLKKSYSEACLKNKIVQIYHGLDFSKLSPSKRFDENKILFAGRLAAEKGVEIAIKSMPLIRKKAPKAILEIAGEGPEKRKLQNLVKKTKLEETVHFLGWLKDKDIMKKRNKANFELMPSLWPEPFGLTGVEAMAMGKPVVGSKVGAIPEWLIDGKTGFLFKPGDYYELAEKALMILEDKGLRDQLSKNARELVEAKFDLNEHVKKIERLYKEILKDG